MFKTRFMAIALAALALSAAVLPAHAAASRAPAPAPVAAPAATPAAPVPAEGVSASSTQPARKEDDVDTAGDSSTAELAPNGDPQAGQVDGELGAAVRPISEATRPTHVDARVLADCEFGKPNDLASVPVDRVAELEGSFVIDTHPAAVDFARRLAAGDIKA